MHSNHKGPPGCDPRKRGGKEDGRGMEEMVQLMMRKQETQSRDKWLGGRGE